MDMTMLVINTVVFGGCLVLLLLGRASGPLILLTVEAFGMLVVYFAALCNHEEHHEEYEVYYEGPWFRPLRTFSVLDRYHRKYYISPIHARWSYAKSVH
jgi:hypothetical protein